MKVSNQISEWLSKNGIATPSSITILAGDGSQRTFYRVHSATDTRILLQDPAWILSKDYAPHQEFLRKRGLPVPSFYNEDPGAGFMLMEDLGDELLQFRMRQDPSSRMAWLKKATVLLGELHAKTFPVPASVPATTRHFDGQKYWEEYQFTFEHLVKGYLKLGALSAEQGTELRKFCDQLGKMGPEVFSHRDYHCRNLLLKNDELYLIDFQDARMGPPEYDLASLLFDAYIPISDAERKELIGLYQSTVSQHPLGKKIDWNAFATNLETVAFQRTVKAAGSFASFFTRYQKATHLEYIVPALASAAQILARNQKIPVAVKKLFPLDQWITKVKTIKV